MPIDNTMNRTFFSFSDGVTIQNLRGKRQENQRKGEHEMQKQTTDKRQKQFFFLKALN